MSADAMASNDEEYPSNSLGLIQVYPKADTEIRPTIDVVAVHGLGGDSRKTWTKDKTFWIQDLLPGCQSFKNARIFTYGYDARAFLHPFERSTTGRTFTFAEALARHRPIIFLCHSLGGIVVKSALQHAYNRQSLYGNILSSTKAIFFFGTPHQGADIAAWSTFLGGIDKMVRVRNTTVLEELKRWSNPLVELTVTFAELAPKFEISTFFEEKATDGVMIVPRGSAQMGVLNERSRGLLADHRNVCKFTVKDPNWNAVKARLEAVAESIEEEISVPTSELPQVDTTDSLLQRMAALKD